MEALRKLFREWWEAESAREEEHVEKMKAKENSEQQKSEIDK